MATLKNTIINDTGYLGIPSGSEAQRPNSPETGYMRFNTDNSVPEIWDGSEWKEVSLTEYVKTYSVTDSTTSTNEGTTITFTTTTENVSNGTTLYYTLSGVDSNDVSTPTSGNFTINNNSGTVSVSITNDLTTEGSETLTFQVRTDSTSGTIVASDTTTINDTSVSPNYTIQYLIVGGGGGGGDRHGGGGGAGGYLSNSFSSPTGTSYTITVGAGGAAGNYEGNNSSPRGSGLRGNDSSISTIDTAYGGGGGGTYDGNPSGTFGSGGGGGGRSRPGIAGTSGQGNSGGSGQNPGGGGGGGAGGVGGNANNGSGGVGLQWLDGNYYAGGGGGAWSSSGGPSTPGGTGGGGDGAWDDATIQSGTANTGGGGGASRSSNTGTTGRPGGSGIVILRYSGSQRGTGGTVTSSGGYTYHTFTSSGTYTS